MKNVKYRTPAAFSEKSAFKKGEKWKKKKKEKSAEKSGGGKPLQKQFIRQDTVKSSGND